MSLTNISTIRQATVLLIATLLIPYYLSAKSPNEDLKLWYDKAATIWEEYLPSGNAEMGMMMSGGVMEMLLQSHDGAITLLPALPTAWTSGEFQGLKARGDVEVSCHWRDGKVVDARLRSSHEQIVVRTAEGHEVEVQCYPNREIRIEL